MKKTALTLASAVTLALLMLGGCASQPDLEDRLAALEEANEKKKEKEQEKAEEILDSVPEWVLELPEPTATGVFGVGAGKNKDLAYALKKARLQASFEVAKQFKQELSGQERSFQRDAGDNELVERTEMLIDSFVESMPVTGYQVVEQEVVPMDGVFHAYVLMLLPYDEFNKVMQAQRDKAVGDEMKAAFEQLEDRIEKRQQARAEEETTKHEREIERMRVEQEGEVIKAVTTEREASSKEAKKTRTSPLELLVQ